MKNCKSAPGWLATLFISAGLAILPAQTSAQTETSSGASAPAQNGSDQGIQNPETVRMSSFEVTTTQGHGYTASTAAAAFKTDEALMNIPQGDIVVSNDFIKDINYENASDVLQYFGVMQNIEGANLQMRGTSILSFPYLDEMPDIMYYQDDAIIDSYEVIKGPAQTLYLGAGLAGVILESTKKPLPFSQNIVTLSVDQWGLTRFTFDTSGPLGKIGDFDFSYRLVGVYQQGHTYFYNTPDDRLVAFPEIQIKYKNTVVRAYWFAEKTSGQEGQAFLTPSGQIETAMGWKGENQYGPSNSQDYIWSARSIFVEVLQKISDNWESRLSASNLRIIQDGPGEYPESVNFDNGTETWFSERDDEHWTYWTVLDDYQGHYELGPENWRMNQSDAFGFAYSSLVDKQFYYDTAPFPWPNGTVGATIAIPYNSSAALWALTTAPPNDISPPSPANWTSQSYANDLQTQSSSIYCQHTMDLVPNWLTIITGWTWDNVASQSVHVWSILPWTGTNISVSQWVHRLGAVLHLTKAVSLYALDSTNFITPLSNTLENGQLPPPELGTGTELGIKWNFFDGRITGESAWFKEVTTNGLNLSAGTNPETGVTYAAVIGSVTEEGVDGDAAFLITPGWQMIGSWYAGHEVDPYGNPVPSSFDNTLAVFSRYDFGRTGVLRGLSFGAGISRTGGRWIASGAAVGQNSSTINIPPVTKIQTGTMMNAFISYQVNKHLGLRVNVANLLDENFPVAAESTPLYIDPSQPRDFTFEMTYKF